MLRFLYLIFFCFSFVFTNAFAATEIIEESHDPVIERICSPTECYTVIEKLGEGAFGRVYAVESSTGERFAIKSHYSSDLSYHLLADAEREFQRGQLLDHPNIVKSFELFTAASPTSETTTNIVLELVEGKTLFNTDKRGLSTDASLNAAAQFINAMQYALSLDLMHIDLHGGNVMLDKNANLKVIDLASFYSTKELFTFIVEESKKKTADQNQSKQPPTPQLASLHKPQSLAKATKMAAAEVQAAPMQEPLRAEKLRKFFNQNPQLFDQLKKIYEKSMQVPSKKVAMLKSMSKRASSQEEAPVHENANHPDLSPLLSYYFERVTEICVDLIQKSDLNRQDKIFLRAEIKKLAWNYQEDLDEGKHGSLNNYLEDTYKVLTTPN